ncbi:MAG: phosphoglucosamine mutase, partial [Fimbriimonadaceae bacterium]
GAAFEIAPKIFESLGARVTTVCCEPDGMNINEEGGATKPERVQNLTKETGADFGVAFDGDADRAIFADRTGLLINGDRTLAIYAQYGLASGELNPPAIVGTVMSNGGFERFLQDLGIELHRTPVGDKYVSRKLREIGGKAGGEQSGHLIFPEISATGDGIATALMLLKVLRSSNQPLEVLANSYDAWPQLLLNVTVEQRDNWDSRPTVRRALDDAEQELEGRGRIVARASGTQPMIRIMVEAECYDLRDRLADSILDAMEKELGATLYSRVDLTHALGD